MNRITIDDITSAFEVFADQAKGDKMAGYLKNKFVCYGIKAPDRRIIQKEFYSELKLFTIEDSIKLARSLYKLPQRELHYFAMEIVGRKSKFLNAYHLEFAEFMVLQNSWWDTVDFVATHIFHPILKQLDYNQKREYVQKLAQHENMWMNRVAIIFQLPLKRETEEELLELAIIPHLNSKEFFHQKAIGWALRQYSKYNPNYVSNFLDSHKLANLSVREASKYLS